MKDMFLKERLQFIKGDPHVVVHNWTQKKVIRDEH
jgi:hypothetical protein